MKKRILAASTAAILTGCVAVRQNDGGGAYRSCKRTASRLIGAADREKTVTVCLFLQFPRQHGASSVCSSGGAIG